MARVVELDNMEGIVEIAVSIGVGVAENRVALLAPCTRSCTRSLVVMFVSQDWFQR